MATTLAAGCARSSAEPRPDAHAEWLRRAFLEHDRPMLARDPTLVAGKYARMAQTKFAFFRGTAWLSSSPREPSRFESPAASQVAVVGDPHPENVGIFVNPRGVRVVELNDFDRAGYGSYVDDLRRMAVGLWIVADMADIKHKQRVRVVGELVDGYVSEVRGLEQGKPPVSLREDAFPGEIDEILVRPDHDDASKDLAATPEETTLARVLLAAYPKTLLPASPAITPAMFALKRVTRRNVGVSSFPVLRLQVVVEGPTAAPDDDWTLELKESVGRPAAQIVAIQRQFQESPDDDPFLGWAAADGREFRVRRILPAQRRLDAERIAKQVKSPRWSKRNLKDLAFGLGRLLARGHARALGRDGKPGLAAIAAALGPNPTLRDEIAAFAERHADTSESDLRLFRRLLADHGPLLGWSADNKN